MTLLIRFLVVAWAVVSVAIGVLAFFVVTGYGNGVDAALYEGLETIPEALMTTVGFRGAPVAVTVAYWLALIAAVFFAFRPARRRG